MTTGADSSPNADPTRNEDAGSGGPRCPFCEAPMYKRHCKYVCPQHGVVIDCSDPFR